MQWKRWAYGFTGVTVVSLLGQAAFSAALLGSSGGQPSFSWVPAAMESFMALNLVPFSIPQRSLHSISSDLQSHLPNYGLESDFQGVPTIMHGGPDFNGLSQDGKRPLGTWGQQQTVSGAQYSGVGQWSGASPFQFGAQSFSTQNSTVTPVNSVVVPPPVDGGETTGTGDSASPPAPVPLPGAVWLFGFGLLGIVGGKRWAMVR